MLFSVASLSVGRARSPYSLAFWTKLICLECLLDTANDISAVLFHDWLLEGPSFVIWSLRAAFAVRLLRKPYVCFDSIDVSCSECLCSSFSVVTSLTVSTDDMFCLRLALASGPLTRTCEIDLCLVFDLVRMSSVRELVLLKNSRSPSSMSSWAFDLGWFVWYLLAQIFMCDFASFSRSSWSKASSLVSPYSKYFSISLRELLERVNW